MRNRFWLVAVLAAVVYSWNFWGTPVYMLDEAMNAGCASEMQRTGNFIVPVFNGEFHDKPVLQYYFMMVAYKVFGVNSFSARLFSVLCGITCALTTFWFAGKIFNPRVAFYSTLMLIASLQMSYQFKMAVPDPYLLAATTAGLFSFYYGYREKKKAFLYLFYACIALGFLAKGPIAIALPGLIVLLFLIWQKDLSLQTLMKLKLFEGIAIAVLISAPWYIAVGVATDWKWPEYFFITHNLSRYVTTFEGHHGFPLDTLVIVIGALLPFSVYAPQAVLVAWNHRKVNSALVFCLICCVAVIGFFLFSKTVLPSYPEPCVPFAAVILGYYLNEIVSGSTAVRRGWINQSILLLIAIAVPVTVYVAVGMESELADLSYTSIYFLPLPAGAVLALILVIRKKCESAFYVSVGSFITVQLLAFSFALPAVYERNPVAQSLSLIAQDKAIAYYQIINPAYVFSLQKNVEKLSTQADVDRFVSLHKNFIIISSKKDWNLLATRPGKIIYEGRDLFENPISILVSDQ